MGNMGRMSEFHCPPTVLAAARICITHNVTCWTERISFFDNNLFSTIPWELGRLANLELLDIGSNQMTGTIPSTLGNIAGLGKTTYWNGSASWSYSFETHMSSCSVLLAGLSLFDNFFSGTIPSELSRLQNLQLIYVDDNDLVGPLPDDICQLDFEEFWSDCQEIQCTCCTTCCSDSAGCVRWKRSIL